VSSAGVGFYLRLFIKKKISLTILIEYHSNNRVILIDYSAMEIIWKHFTHSYQPLVYNLWIVQFMNSPVVLFHFLAELLVAVVMCTVICVVNVPCC